MELWLAIADCYKADTSMAVFIHISQLLMSCAICYGKSSSCWVREQAVSCFFKLIL